MKTNILCAALLAVLVTASCGNGGTKTDSKEIATDSNGRKFDDSLVEGDTEFAVDAADAGMLEVELGKLAATNAASPKVVNFGKMMAIDHGKANSELNTITMAKNITLPAALSEKKQEKLFELSGKKGADFDKAYADYMVEDHKEVIRAFEKESNSGMDPQLKSWATEQVSILKEHLKEAMKLQDALK